MMEIAQNDSWLKRLRSSTKLGLSSLAFSRCQFLFINSEASMDR